MKKKDLNDYFKVDIDRIFSSEPEKVDELLLIIESEVLYYSNKKIVNKDDDAILESLIYWVADFLPRRNEFAERIDAIINGLWGCRDKFLDDKLAYDPKKGY